MTLPNLSPHLSPHLSSQAIAEMTAAIYDQHAAALTQLIDVPPIQQRSLLQDLWLPLALQLAGARTQTGRPWIQGILGGQGTGKSTLAAVLTQLLQDPQVSGRAQGYRCVSLSLDDLYKTYAERQQLKLTDPRLIWRGPPGTHDVDLGLVVLDALRQGEPVVAIPRFDKSLHQGEGDRVTPEIVHNADIVLFEGWFVGAKPVPPAAFDAAPWPIVTASDRAFAWEMNLALETYLPLWQRLDGLVVLYAQDYRHSKTWRKQAEHRMISQGKSGMSDQQIDQFVEYFWKALHPELLIAPLVQRLQQGLAHDYANAYDYDYANSMAIAIDINHQPILNNFKQH